MKKTRTQLLSWMIETAVPFLNMFRNPPKWPYTLYDQRNFPSGSLGREVAYFLDSRGLPLLPKYEVHDTLHVLFQYGTTPFEEMRLQGFMIGNGSSTFAGKVLFVLGLIIMPEYWPQLKLDLQRGRDAKSIKNYNFELLILENTQDIRNRMKLG